MRIKIFLICFVLALSMASSAQDDPIEIRQWASSAEASSSFGSDGWSAAQATGEPNTADCGDFTTAWASATSTETATLTVYFDTPVVPTELNIHQNYNPGAVVELELLSDGASVVSFEVESDEVECPGVVSFTFDKVEDHVDGIMITVDQSITEGWSEIDAVELVGTLVPGDEVAVWANEASATSEYGEDGWGAAQATGEPNTTSCADSTTAWASADSTGVDELTVMFPIALVPTQLDIYQTYNPGAITQVDFILEDESLVTVEDSADPGTDCPGVFSLEIDAEDTVVIGAVIYLDQTITGSWNEIDAVMLTGVVPGDAEEGDLLAQWASEAEASSEFGSDGWSAGQATGEPDTEECGDFTTAWASASSTEEATLTVFFDTAVIPTQVNIHQTFNPGAITGIAVIAADDGEEVEVTDSAEVGVDCPGVLSIDILDADFAVDGVIISLDQSITGNWNEIDAVELIGIPEE